MPCLWVVCGAGRGVGKTRVARGLAGLLPDAAYAKHGHGQPRPDKAGVLLHDLVQVERFLLQHSQRRHLVIESNAMVETGRADLVLFVEGQPVGMPRREDADSLRAAAHIVIDRDQPVARWRRLLTAQLDAATAQAALDLLIHQAAHLPGPTLGAGTKFWLQLPGEHGMGKGLMRLLLEIDQHATLRKASQNTGISYRHAWDLIRTAEKHLGTPLIQSRPGGQGGGGTSLTATGLHLARCFETLDAELRGFAERRLAELLQGGGQP
jgi:molybdate transport system regulatory protein